MTPDDSSPKCNNPGHKVTKAQIKQALRKSGGIISQAAQKLGIARESLWERIQNHSDLKKVQEEAREAVTDMAESVIVKAIADGDIDTARWFLARIGKHRGYTERQEITGPDGGPLRIIVERTITDETQSNTRQLPSESE